MNDAPLPFAWRIVTVFIGAILTECAYTSYAYYVARADKVRGPIFAGLIAIGKGYLVYTYARDPFQIATLAAGQVVGTWLTLTVIKRRASE